MATPWSCWPFLASGSQHGFRNCAARSTSPRRSPPTRPQYHTRGNVLSIRCQAFALNFLKSWSSGGCLPANPVRNADVPSPVPWVTIRSVCAAIPRAAIIPIAGRYMEKILSRVKRDNRKNSPYLPHCAVSAVRIRDVSLVREPNDAQRIRIVPVSLKTGVRHFFAHRPSSLRVPQTHQRLPKNDAHARMQIHPLNVPETPRRADLSSDRSALSAWSAGLSVRTGPLAHSPYSITPIDLEHPDRHGDLNHRYAHTNKTIPDREKIWNHPHQLQNRGRNF